MKNAMEAIKDVLSESRNNEEIAILETRISDISKLWDRYTQLMEKTVECQNKPRI